MRSIGTVEVRATRPRQWAELRLIRLAALTDPADDARRPSPKPVVRAVRVSVHRERKPRLNHRGQMEIAMARAAGNGQ